MLIVLQPMNRMQTTSQPNIQWPALPGATKYDIWIDNHTTGQKQYVRDQNLTTNSWSPAADMPIGVYRVWVRGFDASGYPTSWSSLVQFTVATPPQITSPLNSTFNRRPAFAWSAVTGAEHYEVQIRDLTTGATIYSPTNITTTSWTPPANLPDGPYRWWVVAIGANGVRGLWTLPTDINIGGLTTLLTPTGTTTNTLPTFSWKPVDDSARYELWVTNATTNTLVIHQTSLTTLTYTPSTPLSQGTYRAWVRAVSTTGEVGLWSVQLNFAIAALHRPAGHRDSDGGLETLLTPMKSELAQLTAEACRIESSRAELAAGEAVIPVETDDSRIPEFEQYRLVEDCFAQAIRRRRFENGHPDSTGDDHFASADLDELMSQFETIDI